MKLLVSVANATEAAAALAGGADFIDAKDPCAGALGAVALPVLHDIASTIGGARPVTAALGDAIDEISIERAANAYAAGGAELVKIGFAAVTDSAHVGALLRAAVQGTARHAGVIAVAYADADRAASPDPHTIVKAAAQAGAAGVLLDTADKGGPGLRALMSPAELTSWVSAVHDLGLIVALAGKLTVDDLTFVRDSGADVAGVRGAACEGGRGGRVLSEKVERLRERARRT